MEVSSTHTQRRISAPSVGTSIDVSMAGWRWLRQKSRMCVVFGGAELSAPLRARGDGVKLMRHRVPNLVSASNLYCTVCSLPLLCCCD